MRKMLRLLPHSAAAAAVRRRRRRRSRARSRSALIMPYSGQFADTATQIDNGIKLYMKQNGDTVAGKKIEIIRKDTGGIAPDVAKRLAQELVVRDNVDILAGFVLTPNALAAGDVSAEAKKFMVVMNAATSIITTKSPYIGAHLADAAAGQRDARHLGGDKSGVKKVYTMVSDFGPGHDAEGAFQRAFKEAGGEIVGSVQHAGRQSGLLRLRAARQGPQSGSRSTSSCRAARSRRRSARRSPSAASIPSKIKILGTGEVTDENALKSMGDAALGIITACHYDYNHNSAMNKEFVKAYQRRVTGATPTSSRSAAMTACTSSTRR